MQPLWWNHWRTFLVQFTGSLTESRFSRTNGSDNGSKHRQLFVMRHGERVDVCFRDWLQDCFDQRGEFSTGREVWGINFFYIHRRVVSCDFCYSQVLCNFWALSFALHFVQGFFCLLVSARMRENDTFRQPLWTRQSLREREKKSKAVVHSVAIPAVFTANAVFSNFRRLCVFFGVFLCFARFFWIIIYLM